MVPGPFFGWYSGYTCAQVQTTHDQISQVILECGPFDGICGFSQGATLALSYLLQHQTDHPSLDPPFLFALLFSCAGPAFSYDPMLSLDIISSLSSENLRALERMATRPVPENPDAHIGQPMQDKHLVDRDVYMGTVSSALQLGAANGFVAPSVVIEQWRCAESSADRHMLMPRIFHPSLTASRIRIPTLHVIGSNDTSDVRIQAGICRALCDPSYTTCVQHSAAHDVPHFSGEVDTVVQGILTTIEDAKLLGC